MAILNDFVRPGDVITADLINRMIALINEHDTLINTGGGSRNPVTIDRFVPSPPFEAGQDLQIIGMNFGFSTGSTVLKFDNTQVNAFKHGSKDTSLLVNVPFLSDLGTGKDVVLSISNGATTATHIVRVNPLQQSQQGNVDVLLNDAISPNPNPNPVVEDRPMKVAYQLKSRALLPATFTIGVQCSDATMQAAATVQDAAQAAIGSRQIDLAPGEQKGFFVQFPDVPVAARTAITLTVSANALGVSGSDTRVFIVGSVVAQPDPTIGVAFNRLTASTPGGAPDSTASYTAADNTIRLRQGSIGRVNLVATFENTGTYNVSVAAGLGTSGWTVALAATPSQYIIAASDFSRGIATKNPEIGIQAELGASATGQLRFTLQRQDSTQAREITINLVQL